MFEITLEQSFNWATFILYNSFGVLIGFIITFIIMIFKSKQKNLYFKKMGITQVVEYSFIDWHFVLFYLVTVAFLSFIESYVLFKPTTIKDIDRLFWAYILLACALTVWARKWLFKEEIKSCR